MRVGMLEHLHLRPETTSRRARHGHPAPGVEALGAALTAARERLGPANANRTRRALAKKAHFHGAHVLEKPRELREEGVALVGLFSESGGAALVGDLQRASARATSGLVAAAWTLSAGIEIRRLETAGMASGFLRLNQMGATLAGVSAQWCLLWCLGRRVLPARSESVGRDAPGQAAAAGLFFSPRRGPGIAEPSGAGWSQSPI